MLLVPTLNPKNPQSAIYEVVSAIYTDSNMSVEEKVEKLAEMLLQYPEELRPEQAEAKSQLCADFESHLLSNLMMLMGRSFKDFTFKARDKEARAFEGDQDWDLRDLPSMERLQDVGEGYRYSGKILSQSFQYALKAYGMRDQETGKLVPFARLFFSAYEKKKNNWARERAGFSDKACLYKYQTELKRYLGRIAEEKGIELEASLKGYLSLDDVEELLDLLKANHWQRMYVIKLESLINASSLLIETEDGDSIDVTEDICNENWLSNEQEIIALGDMLRETLGRVNTEGSKNLRRDVIALVTLKAYPVLRTLEAEAQLELEQYIDLALLDFVRNSQVEIPSYRQDEEAVIYAAFLGLKYDTARKRLNLAAAALAKSGQKAA